MKITLRLIISLMLVVSTVAVVSAYFKSARKRKQREELERRSRFLASSLQETIEPLIEKRAISNLQRLVEKFGNLERLAGVAIYDRPGPSSDAFDLGCDASYRPLELCGAHRADG